MLEKNISGLPVIDKEGKLKGIVSESDVIRLNPSKSLFSRGTVRSTPVFCAEILAVWNSCHTNTTNGIKMKETSLAI